MLLLWFIMGVGMSGVGTSVMHDAVHGAYSKNKFVNKIIGQSIVLLGGYYYNWELQHNVLHHSYTNIDGLDEDIDSGTLFRFSPNQEHKKHHRLQYLYCWPLYSLMTIEWSQIILLIVLVLMVAQVFWILRETRTLRMMIESYIKKDSINRGGKNGGAW